MIGLTIIGYTDFPKVPIDLTEGKEVERTIKTDHVFGQCCHIMCSYFERHYCPIWSCQILVDVW